jgi:hypothetical protein
VPEPSRAEGGSADNDKPADNPASGAEVVSLDAFRKKP